MILYLMEVLFEAMNLKSSSSTSAEFALFVGNPLERLRVLPAKERERTKEEEEIEEEREGGGGRGREREEEALQEPSRQRERDWHSLWWTLSLSLSLSLSLAGKVLRDGSKLQTRNEPIGLITSIDQSIDRRQAAIVTPTHLDINPGVSFVDPSIVKLFHLIHRHHRKLVGVLRDRSSIEARIVDCSLRGREKQSCAAEHEKRRFCRYGDSSTCQMGTAGHKSLSCEPSCDPGLH
jgi:hypothetical protein